MRPNVRLQPPPRSEATREPQALLAAVGRKAWLGFIKVSEPVGLKTHGQACRASPAPRGRVSTPCPSAPLKRLTPMRLRCRAHQQCRPRQLLGLSLHRLLAEREQAYRPGMRVRSLRTCRDG